MNSHYGGIPWWKEESFEKKAEEKLFNSLTGFAYGEDTEGKTGLPITVTFFDANGETVGQEQAMLLHDPF